MKITKKCKIKCNVTISSNYNPKKTACLTTPEKSKQEQNVEDGLSPADQTGKSSQLLLHLDEAVIDAKGNTLTGYRTFFDQGQLG